MQSALNKVKSRIEGFTLIELAVVMIVIGLLIASFSPLLTLKIKQERIDNNAKIIATIAGKISSFRSLNGHYPCPAAFGLDRDDPLYGRSQDCSNPSVAVGNCVDGVCIQQGIGTSVDDPANPGTPMIIKPRVRIGTIPFRQLNLPDDSYMRDAYGNIMTYAVTEELAVSSNFDPTHGGITILNDQGASAIDPPNSAHFILLSSGSDGATPVDKNGNTHSCPTGLEHENCDMGLSNDAVFRTARTSTADNAARFDDVMEYSLMSSIPQWETVSAGSTDIRFKQSGNVGVNYTNANAQINDKTHVNGDLRATDNTQAQEYCNEKGQDCFPVSVISGPLPDSGTKCPADTYMTGFDRGHPVCAPITTAMVQSCNPGEYMVGINADGSAQCKVLLKSCSAMIVDLCGGSYTLNAAASGKSQTIKAGANFSQKYTCVDGVWVAKSNSGSCTCTVETDTQNVSCGSGFNGSIGQTRTKECPSGNWGPWEDTPGGNTCVCLNTKQTQTLSCPISGYTGGIKQERVHDCTTAAGSWGPWVTVSDTCKCTPDDQTRKQTCPKNFAGTIEQARNFTCPDAKWSAWEETLNTCKCTPKTEKQDVDCPEGYDGVVKQERDITCPDGTATAWREVSNTCKLRPPAACVWNPLDAGEFSDTPLGKKAGSGCKCGDAPKACNRATGGGFLNFGKCECGG